MPAQPGLHSIDMTHYVLSFIRTNQADDRMVSASTRHYWFDASYSVGHTNAREQPQSLEITWPSMMAILKRLEADPGRRETRLEFGDTLRQLLLPAGWGQHEAEIRKVLANPARSLQVTVQSNAPEIYRIPWELLNLQEKGPHLGANSRVMIGYSWPTKPPDGLLSPRSLHLSRPKRVVLAWSGEDNPPPVRLHLNALVDAQAAGGLSFQDRDDVIASMSLQALRKRLAEVEPHEPVALHLLCHGAESQGKYGLVCSDDDERRIVVSAVQLRDTMTSYADKVALLVLCVCNSGNETGIDSDLGSLAQACHRIGIPWVIGSRFPLSKRDSVRLCQNLYMHMVESGGDIEKSFAHARNQFIAQQDSSAWCGMQLYAHDYYRRTADHNKTAVPTASKTSKEKRSWRRRVVMVGLVSTIGLYRVPRG